MPSLYDITIPMLMHRLKALSAILKKAEDYAIANKVPLNDYLETRLIADMNPFTFQVQNSCDTAMLIAVRVGGLEAMAVENKAKPTFDELQSRITATLGYLSKVKPDDLNKMENEVIVFQGVNFNGVSYCTLYAMPNFYFHVSMAYAILRMKGVPIGKVNYHGQA